MSTEDQELSRIHARLDSQSQVLTEVRDAVRDVGAAVREQCAVSRERFTAFEKELADHKRALFGNGRPGLDDRVTALETMNDGKRMQVGTGSISVKAVVAIIVAIGTMIGGLMGYLPSIVEAFTKQ
jgi:hypothetical protein